VFIIAQPGEQPAKKGGEESVALVSPDETLPSRRRIA
jgi:hypothetical protein